MSRATTSRPLAGLLASLSIIGLAACSGGGTEVTPQCTVSAIAVTAPSSTVIVGQTIQAAANYTVSNCSPAPTLTWTSDNNAVATVASDGRVTGVTPGGPVIIRAATNGQSGTVQITVVPVPVATVAITPTTASVIVGQTTTLTATARDGAGNTLTGRTVVWTTSSASLATVNGGVVTGVAPGGPVTITATVEGVGATAAITVNPIPVATVTLSQTSGTLVPTQTLDLTATARDAGNNVLTGRTVVWASANQAVATVTNGRVTGVAAGGPVNITATVEGIVATAAITVNAPVALAYGLAGTATPGAPYTATEAFSGAGDLPTVAKVGTGSYEVTIPGMSASNANQRYVYVNARATFAQCHPNGTPTNVGTSLLLKVICGSVNTGAATDAPFSFVAFGGSAFTGRTGFLSTPTAAIAASPFSPTSPFTYTSRGTDADVTVEGQGSAGRYLIKFLALARGGSDVAENHFSQSWGTSAATWCADGGWSLSIFSATVYCYDAAGALVDERFGTLVIDRGRVGKRFAVSWVYDPATPTNPVGTYTNSTGGAITINRLSLGSYDVTFAGLGASTAPVAAIVSSYGGSASNSHCTVVQITRSAPDLVVRVACVTAGAALNIDQVFTIAVIE